MQFVDINVLKKLSSSNGKIVEYDNSEFSYTEFLKVYNSILNTEKKKSSRMHRVFSNKDAISYAYDQLNNTYLATKCPPIQFVGEGSSRSAYALAGGKCLKIAINTKGIAQNKEEIKNTQHNKYSCFVQLYEYDKINYCSLLSECCSHILYSDVEKYYQVESFDDVCQMLIKIKLNGNFSVDDTIKYYSMKKDIFIKHLNDQYGFKFTKIEDYNEPDLDDYVKIIDFCEKIKSNTAEQWQILRDLLQFYIDNGRSDSRLIIDDLGNAENWGLAIRNGYIVPVILDVGFSEKVLNKHYS